MSRINLEGLRTRDIRHGPGFVLQSASVIAGTGYVISPDSPPLLFMAPLGAINVIMPESTAVRRGLVFIFVNTSGNVITLQTNGGAGFTTAITVAANASTRVVCTGSSTQALGWAAW